MDLNGISAIVTGGASGLGAATARKLAILVYRTLKGELRYQDPGADAYDRHQRTRTLRRLRHRAATLGFDLVDRQTGQILSPAST